jgi:uncharacterized protein (TIGR02452 family)
MNRLKIARETLKIQRQGYYEHQSHEIIEKFPPPTERAIAACRVLNQSTVQTIMEMNHEGKSPAVLNFASAKRPGGAFLIGGMAQEESLATSSGLYNTLLCHPAYYDANRVCGTAIYTDYAIYAPDVVFFRDGQFSLLDTPVTAYVLTLPAVNMGQVRMSGEDIQKAKMAMKNRMRLCLAIFAKQKNDSLILGAYGCGVFRNDSAEVAEWWKVLLEAEGYGRFFDEICFAVLDKSAHIIEPFLSRFAD